MSLPFSSTSRSLEKRGLRLAPLTLLLSAALALGWIVWLLGAPITQWTKGDVIRITPRGVIQARFTTLPAMLHFGQPAWLQLESPDLGLLPLTVAGLPTAAEPRLLEFYIVSETFPIELTQLPIKGTVEIEVERLTPLTWLWRSYLTPQ